MKFLIAIDDTDDLTKETSTGLIASKIAAQLQKNYPVKMHQGVTRHQLLLQDGIPYTSHNSVMCIDIEGDITMDILLKESKETVRNLMSSTSCPGICICCIDKITHLESIIHFGKLAKHTLLFKEQAYELTSQCEGIIAEELGGNGQGIIGSVAGIGLRLSGNDGTFRGKIHVPETIHSMIVKEMLDRYRLDAILDLNSKYPLALDTIILNDEPAKIFFRNHNRIAYATKAEEDQYILCNREKALKMGIYCQYFESDNDSNECISSEKRCENCLYRRLTKHGFKCSHQANSSIT